MRGGIQGAWKRSLTWTKERSVVSCLLDVSQPDQNVHKESRNYTGTSWHLVKNEAKLHWTQPWGQIPLTLPFLPSRTTLLTYFSLAVFHATPQLTERLGEATGTNLANVYGYSSPYRCYFVIEMVLKKILIIACVGKRVSTFLRPENGSSTLSTRSRKLKHRPFFKDFKRKLLKETQEINVDNPVFNIIDFIRLCFLFLDCVTENHTWL